jgi:myo-inositol 2-dehydrogenase/D-chiro-inositol 1-dehydrogenase
VKTIDRRKLKVCLIGCGDMGAFHARAIRQNPNVSELTLSDADALRAQHLAQELDASWLSLDDAFLGLAFNAYFIVSPPAAHLAQATCAANTGAYVFCEKPLGEDLASIDSAMPALRSYKDRIQVGFNRRFDPHMADLKARIAAGAIGQVEQLRIVSRDHTPPGVGDLKNSSGLITETTIHDFDLCRWLLDDEMSKVMCMGGALINPEYETLGHIDTATTLLQGSRGQQVVIQNSWRTSYGYDQRVEAFGSGGRLTVANPSGPLVLQEDAGGLCRKRIAPDWLVRYQEAYVLQAASFLDSVAQGTTVTPNLNDGYLASFLAEKAAEALRSGRSVSCDTD